MRVITYTKSPLETKDAEMKKTLLAVSLLAALSFPLVLAQESKRVAEAPKFAVGDEWQFSTQNIADRGKPVTSTDRVESVDLDSVWWLTTSADQVRKWSLIDSKHAARSAQFDFDDKAGDKRGRTTRDGDSLIQFPIEAGKKYNIKFKWVSSNGGEGRSDLSATVKTLEKIPVAAGQFEAFRIEIQGWWYNGNYSGRQQQTLWYAPDVKRVIKSEHKDFQSNGSPFNHSVVELVEFKPSQLVGGSK